LVFPEIGRELGLSAYSQLCMKIAGGGSYPVIDTEGYLSVIAHCLLPDELNCLIDIYNFLLLKSARNFAIEEVKAENSG